MSPIADSYYAESVSSVVVNFDNTGLILAIGTTYKKDEQNVAKIEFHSISEAGSKGKFQNIFLTDTS